MVFMIIKSCTSLLLAFKDVVKISLYLVTLTELFCLYIASRIGGAKV